MSHFLFLDTLPFTLLYLLYLCIFTDSEKEAKNAEKFFKSVFYRAGLASKMTSWILVRKWHGNIILQDFTENSDICWDTSIEEIDNQLFKKYNLSDLEIEKIRKYICDKDV